MESSFHATLSTSAKLVAVKKGVHTSYIPPVEIALELVVIMRRLANGSPLRS
jgi:hypothetical protein